MDDFEQGLFTGCAITCLVFVLIGLELWQDSRRNAEENARWFREHQDWNCAPQMPQYPKSLRAASEQGAEALAGRDRNGARRSN